MLAVIASSLFWAGSAPAWPSPPPDVAANTHSDDGSDAGSEVPLAPPEPDQDQDHPESGSDPPLEVPEAHSLPMSYLAYPDEVADMPVNFQDRPPPLQEPDMNRDPPRRARPSAAKMQEGEDSSRIAASSSSQQQGQQDPPQVPHSSVPHPLHAHGLSQPQLAGSQQENVYNMAELPPLQRPELPHQQHTAAYMPWSAWDEEFDTRAQSQPLPTLQMPAMPSQSTFRLGYANQYDPNTDPWHEEGQLGEDERQHDPMAPYTPSYQRPHAAARPTDRPSHQQPPRPGDQQPPTMDPWHSLTRELASTGPLLPPSQWAHNNAMGLQPPTTEGIQESISPDQNGDELEPEADQPPLPQPILVHQCNTVAQARQQEAPTAQEGPHSPSLQADRQEPTATCEDALSSGLPDQQSEKVEANEMAGEELIAEANEDAAEDIQTWPEDEGEEIPTEDDDLEWDSDEDDEDSDPDLQAASSPSTVPQQQGGNPQRQQAETVSRTWFAEGEEQAEEERCKTPVEGKELGGQASLVVMEICARLD